MVVWTGDGTNRLAPALLTLYYQLRGEYPGAGWQNSPETGTIGDAKHFAEGSASDHNPWLDHTVRAIDIASNVSGVAGIVTVTDAPDCEALFRMVNHMYADHDPRIWPNGYGIYNRRITDWNNPGGYHAQTGDPHLYHLHISVSQNAAGFNSTELWPLPGEIMALTPEDKAWLADQILSGAKAVMTDLTGTKVRIAKDDPIIADIDKRLAALQATLTNFQSGSAPDAKAVVDEIGRRLANG